jgi:hypothetical protein
MLLPACEGKLSREKNTGDRWGPLTLEFAPNRSRIQNQAGRFPLKINDLRNDSIVFAQLPKLDVAGSSPVARSARRL